VINQQQKMGAIYCRLSRDDGGDSESNSIGNQREMLRQYAKEKGIAIRDEYVDDGISGLTFDRPQFQKMVKDIEDKKISIVIVKDLSRLGRNNALVAYYTEIFFVERDIRFIAVNDNIDSAVGENEIMGFKSVINEFYARDISKKIRSSVRTMALKGQYRGAFPPYGYMRDPFDKHRFAVDPETAPNVKEMFAMAAEGVSVYTIATHFTKRKVLIPTAYRNSINGSGKNDNLSEEQLTYWHAVTVRNILKNKQYLGHLISQRFTTKSFKSKKRVYRPESEWIIVHDTHEPLTDVQTFNKVQNLVKTKKREFNANTERFEENVFAGLLQCSTCGGGMCYNSPQCGRKSGAYTCTRYKKHNPAKPCASHYIMYRELYDLVLAGIQKLSATVKEHKSDLEAFYKEHLNREADENNLTGQQKLEKYRQRVGELDSILKKIVEKNALGYLNDEQFSLLSEDYAKERRDLCGKIETLQGEMDGKKDTLQNAECFFGAIERYTDITELTVAMLHELIERIVVHQAVGRGKAKTQRVDIYWRFIGLLGSDEPN